jgi:hypothetical protein
VIVPVFAAIAMLTKEAGFVFPAILLCWLWVYRRFGPEEVSMKRGWVLVISSAAAAALMIPVRMLGGAQSPFITADGFNPVRYLFPLFQSAVELLQPFRFITFRGAPEQTGPTVALAIGIAVIVLWIFVAVYIFRRHGMQGILAVAVPPALICVLYSVMGWVHPRLLYIPAALLFMALGALLMSSPEPPSRRVKSVFVFLFAVQCVSCIGVVRYYGYLHAANKAQIFPASAALPAGYCVIATEHNRQWHAHHGAVFMPALFSEADPPYEIFIHGSPYKPFTAKWKNGVLAVTSKRPNRFFQTWGGDAWQNIIPKGGVLDGGGYGMVVTKTGLGNRALGLEFVFAREWINTHQLYIDDGLSFTRVKFTPGR